MPLAGTQRIGGKKGTKRHLLVDGRGVPLSIVVTGANRHDVTQLEVVLDEIMIYRPLVHDVAPSRVAEKLGQMPSHMQHNERILIFFANTDQPSRLGSL